jgi:hypothetical protein
MPQEQAGRGVATGRPFARHLGLLGATLLLRMLALEAFLLIRIAASERARHEQEARDAAHYTALVADKVLVATAHDRRRRTLHFDKGDDLAEAKWLIVAAAPRADRVLAEIAV